MKILGCIIQKFLNRITFKIVLVLFIIFTAVQLVGLTLVENISGVSRHRRENLEKLNQNLIGKGITDPAQNSNPILTFGEKHPATEEYLASIKQKDNATLKKQNNSS
jgi:hypothetical protein